MDVEELIAAIEADGDEWERDWEPGEANAAKPAKDEDLLNLEHIVKGIFAQHEMIASPVQIDLAKCLGE